MSADEYDKLDAMRYRWLRSRLYAMDSTYCGSTGLAVIFRFPLYARIGANEGMDAAIDEAMKDSK